MITIKKKEKKEKEKEEDNKNLFEVIDGQQRTTTLSILLLAILNKIKERDEKRALDVYSFFVDFYKVVDVLNKLTKDNATICMVVGNRTVKKS